MLLHCSAVYFKNFGPLNDSEIDPLPPLLYCKPFWVILYIVSHLTVGLNIFFYYTFWFAFKDFLMHSHLIILVVLTL